MFKVLASSDFSRTKYKLTKSQSVVFDKLMEHSGVQETTGEPETNFELTGTEYRSTFVVRKAINDEGEVYIKTIPEDITGSLREKFELKLLNEAAALATLNQAGGAPRLISIGHYESEFYLVTEAVAGKDMTHEIAANPTESLSLVTCALKSLSLVHDMGILHRDLHPGNIMVDRSRATYLDFDCAMVPQMLDLELYFGTVFGAEDYQAPGRKAGDQRTSMEICSLGLSIYKSNLLARIKRQDPHRILLEEVLRKATEPQPERRYQDCQAAIEEIRSMGFAAL